MAISMALAKQLAEKEEFARREGIKSIIMDLRMLLDKLNIVKLPNSSFPSLHYMDRHSPLYKKKV